jgi:hypothetical protein
MAVIVMIVVVAVVVGCHGCIVSGLLPFTCGGFFAGLGLARPGAETTGHPHGRSSFQRLCTHHQSCHRRQGCHRQRACRVAGITPACQANQAGGTGARKTW